MLSSCDLTPGVAGAGGTTDAVGNVVHRYVGDENGHISTDQFNTRCATGRNTDSVVSVSNLPTGDLAVLDATYDSVTKLRR